MILLLTETFLRECVKTIGVERKIIINITREELYILQKSLKY